MHKLGLSASPEWWATSPPAQTAGSSSVIVSEWNWHKDPVFVQHALEKIQLTSSQITIPPERQDTRHCNSKYAVHGQYPQRHEHAEAGLYARAPRTPGGSTRKVFRGARPGRLPTGAGPGPGEGRWRPSRSEYGLVGR